MRCKCCNNPNTKFILDDFYCTKCSGVIWTTIREDKEDYYEKSIRELSYVTPKEE